MGVKTRSQARAGDPSPSTNSARPLSPLLEFLTPPARHSSSLSDVRSPTPELDLGSSPRSAVDDADDADASGATSIHSSSSDEDSCCIDDEDLPTPLPSMDTILAEEADSRASGGSASSGSCEGLSAPGQLGVDGHALADLALPSVPLTRVGMLDAVGSTDPDTKTLIKLVTESCDKVTRPSPSQSPTPTLDLGDPAAAAATGVLLDSAHLPQRNLEDALVAAAGHDPAPPALTLGSVAEPSAALERRPLSAYKAHLDEELGSTSLLEAHVLALLAGRTEMLPRETTAGAGTLEDARWHRMEFLKSLSGMIRHYADPLVPLDMIVADQCSQLLERKLGSLHDKEVELQRRYKFHRLDIPSRFDYEMTVRPTLFTRAEGFCRVQESLYLERSKHLDTLLADAAAASSSARGQVQPPSSESGTDGMRVPDALPGARDGEASSSPTTDDSVPSRLSATERRLQRLEGFCSHDRDVGLIADKVEILNAQVLQILRTTQLSGSNREDSGQISGMGSRRPAGAAALPSGAASRRQAGTSARIAASSPEQQHTYTNRAGSGLIGDEGNRRQARDTVVTGARVRVLPAKTRTSGAASHHHDGASAGTVASHQDRRPASINTKAGPRLNSWSGSPRRAPEPHIFKEEWLRMFFVRPRGKLPRDALEDDGVRLYPQRVLPYKGVFALPTGPSAVTSQLVRGGASNAFILTFPTIAAADRFKDSWDDRGRFSYTGIYSVEWFRPKWFRDQPGVPSVSNRMPEAFHAARYVKERQGGDKTCAGVGLRNLGNTCFVSAALQTLRYLPSFTNALLAMPARRGRGDWLSLVQSFLAECSRGVSVVEPRKIVDCLGLLSRAFQPKTQHDAHEFLSRLLDAMHEVCLMEAGIHDAGGAATLVSRMLLPRLFRGQLRSRRRCDLCGFESSTLESVFDINLAINGVGVHSLEDAFRLFTAETSLDGESKWYCGQCKEHVCATHTMSLVHAPEVLLVQLKRFTTDSQGNPTKETKHVSYPLTWSVPVGASRETVEYELISLVAHHGDSIERGHYTATCREADGSWTNFDDERADANIAKTQVLDQQAYVLVYVQRGKSGSQAAHPESQVLSATSKSAQDSSPAQFRAGGSSQSGTKVLPHHRSQGMGPSRGEQPKGSSEKAFRARRDNAGRPRAAGPQRGSLKNRPTAQTHRSSQQANPRVGGDRRAGSQLRQERSRNQSSPEPMVAPAKRFQGGAPQHHTRAQQVQRSQERGPRLGSQENRAGQLQRKRRPSRDPCKERGHLNHNSKGTTGIKQKVSFTTKPMAAPVKGRRGGASQQQDVAQPVTPKRHPQVMFPARTPNGQHSRPAARPAAPWKFPAARPGTLFDFLNQEHSRRVIDTYSKAKSVSQIREGDTRSPARRQLDAELRTSSHGQPKSGKDAQQKEKARKGPTPRSSS
jgi:ubiquitin carboxyl-terminal hydrolase 36/42